MVVRAIGVGASSSIPTREDADARYQATLIAGNNIKTIGGVSPLGSGDITVSATPGGSTGQVQFNSSSAFAGDSQFIFDATTHTLALNSVSPGFGAHRFWRINVTLNNGAGSNWSVAGVQFRNSAGGANVATGGSAAAQTTLGAFVAGNAFDSNSSTLYAATLSTGWLRYDFGSGVSHEVVEVVITNRVDGLYSDEMRNFDVQWSDTGIDGSWTTAWSVTGQTGWALGESRVFTAPTYSNAAIQTSVFRGQDASGTNARAMDTLFMPGRSTGNATPAAIRLQRSSSGSSGTALQTLMDAMVIDAAGVTVTSAFTTMGATTLGNLSVDTIYTTSPNNTVNVVCLNPTGGTTNVDLALKPKGTGALTAHIADSTSTGGNKRGAFAVDLQLQRDSAAKVASGSNSVVLGGFANVASATGSTVAGGYYNTSSGQYSICVGGDFHMATGDYSFCSGRQNVASGLYAQAQGYGSTASGIGSRATGIFALSNRYAQEAQASCRFAAVGDSQKISFTLANKTTNATPTNLWLDGTGATYRLTIPSGKVLSFTARICGVKSDGSAIAHFVRKGTIKNVSGTTSIVGSIEPIGTDQEDNASTDVAITADDANDALQIQVTGISGETWRWSATVEGIEQAYGV